MKKNYILKIVFKHPVIISIIAGLVIANIIFIWAHSMVPRSQSKQESLFIGSILLMPLEFIFGKGNVNDYLVRKLAHFAEFFSLGTLSSLFLILSKRYMYIAKKIEKFDQKNRWNNKSPGLFIKLANWIQSIKSENRAVVYCIIVSLILVLFVASMDEFIQSLTDRGPLITDVMLDFCAGSIAVIFVNIVFAIIKFFKYKNSKN